MSPHPSSPKYEQLMSVCGFRVCIVGFRGGVCLQAKHPENHNVKAKIRQQLQFLQDRGVVRFLGRGRYRMKLTDE